MSHFEYNDLPAITVIIEKLTKSISFSDLIVTVGYDFTFACTECIAA